MFYGNLFLFNAFRSKSSIDYMGRFCGNISFYQFYKQIELTTR